MVLASQLLGSRRRLGGKSGHRRSVVARSRRKVCCRGISVARGLAGAAAHPHFLMGKRSICPFKGVLANSAVLPKRPRSRMSSRHRLAYALSVGSAVVYSDARRAFVQIAQVQNLGAFSKYLGGLHTCYLLWCLLSSCIRAGQLARTKHAAHMTSVQSSCPDEAVGTNPWADRFTHPETEGIIA